MPNAMPTDKSTDKSRYSVVALTFRLRRSDTSATSMVTGQSERKTVLMLSFWKPKRNCENALKRSTVDGTASPGSELPACPCESTNHAHGAKATTITPATIRKRLSDPGGKSRGRRK